MTNEPTHPLAVGRYELVSSDNYGEFLKAMGVGSIQRNLAEKARPTVEISIDDGIWTVRTLTALENSEIRFEPGKQFTEQLEHGGGPVPSVARLADEKLLRVRTHGADVSTIISEFFPTELRQVFSASGVTATRVYRRL